MSEVRLTSKSEMQTFFGCPSRWRYGSRGITGIAVDMTALRFGSSVHAKIARYLEELKKGRQLTTKNGIREAIQRLLEDVDGDQVRLQKIEEFVADYEMWRLKEFGVDNFKPVFIEKRFDIPPFKGIVDFVHRTNNPNEVIIVDWKTGRYSPDEWNSIQMTIYSYFLGKSGFSVAKGITYFVEHGMKTQAVIDYDMVKQKAESFFNKTSNPNYHFPKVKSFYCSWCQYQLICYYEESPPILSLPIYLTSDKIQLLKQGGAPVTRYA